MVQVHYFDAPEAAGCFVLVRFQRYAPWNKREPFSFLVLFSKSEKKYQITFGYLDQTIFLPVLQRARPSL
jgi:hypothetical protein